MPMLDNVNKVKSLAFSLAAVGAKVEDSDIVTQLLTGLPEDYETLVVSMDGQTCGLEDVTTRLFSEERRRLDRSTQIKSDSVALFTKKAQPKQPIKKDIFCYRCNQPDHIAKKVS